MSTEYTRTQLRSQALDVREIVGRVDRGVFTATAGSILLREVEHLTRILGRLSDGFADHRAPDRIDHFVEAFLSSRCSDCA